MTRARISTTVDRILLDDARRLHAGTTDAELVDEALAALLARYRSAEIDASYEAAYEAHPIDREDDWGDLASFRRAASAT
jgi:antitoxin MazE5